jgi:chromate transporter
MSEQAGAQTRSSAWTIFLTFLRLGCTSFGGPIAHLVYFREEFVVRRQWVDDAAFTDVVGLCQFVPGPASSQVGFTIGLLRGGVPGALAAWTVFTLPSALLMFAVA